MLDLTFWGAKYIRKIHLPPTGTASDRPSVGGQPISAMCGGSSQDGVLGCLKWERDMSSHDESKGVYRELLTEPPASIKPTDNFSLRGK